MPKYVKRVVIYCDVVVEAENEEEAERIFQEIRLVNAEYVPEYSEVVDDRDSEWRRIEE